MEGREKRSHESGVSPDDGSVDRGSLFTPPGNPIVAGFTAVVP